MPVEFNYPIQTNENKPFATLFFLVMNRYITVFHKPPHCWNPPSGVSYMYVHLLHELHT